MLQLNNVILTDMKKELEKLQPDISNIIYRGLAKFVPDYKINLVDDVATELVEYISERLVKNNGVLDDVINCDCENIDIEKVVSSIVVVYKCKKCGGCL